MSVVKATISWETLTGSKTLEQVECSGVAIGADAWLGCGRSPSHYALAR